jgi:two-component system, NtrC family, sensor kinase
MASRTSLRKKLASTFLVGSLITVVLFSLVIKGIVNDYFQRQSAVSRQFIQDQSTEAVRTNLKILKDRIQQTFASGKTAIDALCASGWLGDQFGAIGRNPRERESAARLLRAIQEESTLSLITLVDAAGTVVLRASNPAAFGDRTLTGEYSNPGGPVSSIQHLVDAAIGGQKVTVFESFAPEALALENYFEDGKVVSSLKDAAAIPLRSADPPRVETRALILTYATPVLNSQGKVVGAVIAGRLINKDLSIVQAIRNLLQDHATIFFGQVRVATTRTRQNGSSQIGTVHPDQAAVAGGYYNERQSRRPIEGEELMGVFDPIKDFDGKVLGSLYIGRPLSLVEGISKAQDDIENGIERKTTLYIVALAVVSFIISIVIASILSKRIAKQIDKLRKGAETISQGNLDYRLQINSGDEIEVLAQQFNAMAAQLHESYQTLEKKVEERTRELKESQQAMVQQEKMVGIGQLAAGIAHELNTPLGTIIGYAQMLREDLALQPSVNGSLNDVDEIIGQAGRCRDLVKNLLNFSRRSTTEKSEASVNAIVRKILSLVEHDFEMKRVHISTALDPGLPNAKVNENEIAQVVLNLANNAVDSMQSGGELHVRTVHEESSDRICIEISDTGVGISESDRNRVFEPFFTTKEIGKGTGLGLSICYKIVENHMGSMEFDSIPGQGTTFRVYLPVNAEVGVG